MLDEFYDAIFEDAQGRESTRIHNNGKELRLSLRGIEFVGGSFDGLEPADGDLQKAATLFALNGQDLCAYRLAWTMPIVVEHQGERLRCELSAELRLGNALPNSRLDFGALQLELKTPFATVQTTGTETMFEDALLELVGKLGDTARICACITCAFSDYSPYGSSSFGGMACFRDAKEAYLKTTGKSEFFGVLGRRSGWVQETYLCDEYQVRIPGTGYRG